LWLTECGGTICTPERVPVVRVNKSHGDLRDGVSDDRAVRAGSESLQLLGDGRGVPPPRGSLGRRRHASVSIVLNDSVLQLESELTSCRSGKSMLIHGSASRALDLSRHPATIYPAERPRQRRDCRRSSRCGDLLRVSSHGMATRESPSIRGSFASPCGARSFERALLQPAPVVRS